RSIVLGAQDQGDRIAAGDDGAGDGCRRPIGDAGLGAGAGSAQQRARARARLGQRGDQELPLPARRLDLWRHQRDPEEHPDQSRAGSVMDFEFTDEQRLLRDSVDRLLADHYGFAQRRGYLAEPEGWSTALWSRYAEQGLLGLPFVEEYGGFGGGPIDVMLVMEALGRVLALEPYLGTGVLAGAGVRLG